MIGHYERDPKVEAKLDKIELVRKHLTGFDAYENLGPRGKDGLCNHIANKLTSTGAGSQGIIIEEAKFALNGRG